MSTKICTKCQKEKNESSFHKRFYKKSNKFYVRNICKNCYIANIDQFSKEEIKILKKYYGEIPTKKIIELYLPNRNLASIHRKVQNLNLKSRGIKYYYDENSFDKVTNETCYFAGLLAADGNIAKTEKYFTLTLHEKDSDIIQNFVNFMKSTKPIRYYKKIYQVIQYSSKQIINNLKNIYNITPKKSLTLLPPKLINLNHKLFFIAGYHDGDGCFSKQGQSIILGTLPLLSWIGETISEIDSSLKYSIRPDRNIYRLVMTKRSASIFFRKIYRNNFTFGNRKKEKFFKYMDY